MGYTGKMTSCKRVLAAIERTFKPSGSSWINEAIEDIGWAIPAIGYHIGFQKKQTAYPYLTVAHNRTKIPCDVERIIAVEMLVPTSSQSNVLNPDGTTPEPSDEETCITSYRGVRLPLGSDLTGYGLAEDNLRTTQITPGSYYYNLNADYVVTSFTDGLIKLHYIGYALDKDQMPMIVDDPDYIKALEWYCFSNMLLKGYKHVEVGYKDAFAMWEMYRLRAENAGKMQSLDGADRFRATFVRVNNGVHITNEFFMGMEQTEYISR